jgi:hypothetical protein
VTSPGTIGDRARHGHRQEPYVPSHEVEGHRRQPSPAQGVLARRDGFDERLAVAMGDTYGFCCDQQVNNVGAAWDAGAGQGS